MTSHEDAPRALERRRSRLGWERKQIDRAVAWAEDQARRCHTDAMRARLLEEFLLRVGLIRTAPPARRDPRASMDPGG